MSQLFLSAAQAPVVLRRRAARVGAVAALLVGATIIGGCASARPMSHTHAGEGHAATSEAAVSDDAPIDAEDVTLVVYGMSCPQCASNINRQLLTLFGVRTVDVDLGTGDVNVGIRPGGVTRAQLRDAVARAGYTIRDIRVAG